MCDDPEGAGRARELKNMRRGIEVHVMRHTRLYLDRL
jgi:hypothetical protein